MDLERQPLPPEPHDQPGSFRGPAERRRQILHRLQLRLLKRLLFGGAQRRFRPFAGKRQDRVCILASARRGTKKAETGGRDKLREKFRVARRIQDAGPQSRDSGRAVDLRPGLEVPSSGVALAGGEGRWRSSAERLEVAA
jgi:hypothetical protein